MRDSPAYRIARTGLLLFVVFAAMGACLSIGADGAETSSSDELVADDKDGTESPESNESPSDSSTSTSSEDASGESSGGEIAATSRVRTPTSESEERDARPEPEPDPAPTADTPEEAASGGASTRGGRAEEEGPVFFETESGTGRSGESGLSAGFSDDNLQYGYFLRFLEEFSYADHIPLDVTERIILKLNDLEGRSVPNARVEFFAGQSPLEHGKTTADGTIQFNPSLHDGFNQFSASIEGSAGANTVSFERDGERLVEVSFEEPRTLPDPIPGDIVFVLDTTGSTGEEIDRLRRTIELIYLNLTTTNQATLVRFGMVLYKDLGDEYRTRLVEPTADLAKFRSELEQVRASGGGDTPEDLQAALEESMNRIEWNTDGIRLVFVITDAAPHLDYEQEFDYTRASCKARSEAIKIFGVGTGGLDIHGEYVLRQIAQFTGGAYIFLTYGESEGGAPGSVSHHTGSNYQTDKLEAIIIRLAKEELAHMTGVPPEQPQGYFTASKIGSEEREETLSILFAQALEQLTDFATMSVPEAAPVAVIPFEASDSDGTVDAEYFTEQLIFEIARNAKLALVERRNLSQIIEEQKVQLSGLTDSETVTRIGELLNTHYLISGTLFFADNYELFLSLLRVETGEVLSVTKAVIDPMLGLGQ